MAKSVLDLIIKLSKQGNADKETVTGLYKLKSAITSAAVVTGTLVAAGYAVNKAFDETVGLLVEYADKVRRIHDATGVSVEDASKLIQILDDQKISFEQLEKVVAKNGKTYDYSAEGLARMSDEFLELTDSNQQAAYMQARFGKDWISFVPVMKQGSQAIREASDAVDENLVLTEKDTIQTRLWEIQVDNAKDTWDGFMMSIGKGALGALDGSTDAIHENAQAIFEAAKGYSYAGRFATEADKAIWEEALKVAEAEWVKANALDASTTATDAAIPSAEGYAEALKEQAKANTDLLGLISKVGSEEKSYQETAAQLAQERVKIEQERAVAILQGWWEGSEKIKEFDAALDENATKVEENAAKHHEAMGKIQYDLLITRLSVDGLTNEEYAMAEQAGLMFGVFDQASVTTAKNMDDVTQAVQGGLLKLEDMQRVLDMMKTGYTIDVALRILSSMANSPEPDVSTPGAKRRHGGAVGFAGGGIATGPESGHWELLHGNEAVIPLQNGAVPVQMSGSGASSGGGDVYNVTLKVESAVTVMDEQKTQNVLLPYIITGIRQAKAQGAIK